MFIVISKNIASGGSTLLRMLKKQFPDIIPLQEPVEDWYFLKLFYEDPVRWGYSFQMETFATRSLLYRQADYQNRAGRIVIAERSIYDDRFIFEKMLYDNGTISEVEHKSYCHLFDLQAPTLYMRPDYYVYLKVSPEICWQRKNKRDRIEESNLIAPEYLNTIGKYTDAFIQYEAPRIVSREVITIETNGDFENDNAEWKKVCGVFQEIFEVKMVKAVAA